MAVSSEQLLNEDYDKIVQEYGTYQTLAEKTIESLNSKNIELEKKLDSLTNIVEVSKYINSYISDDNLIPMINDMILGILGVTYSSIYLKEGEELTIRASNADRISSSFSEDGPISELINEKPFIINSKEPLFKEEKHKAEIHSLIGVPITLREKFLGYIIVEHTLYGFFDYKHVKFISSIANQIGIALENNILYKKIKDASIRDPLLNIYNRKYFFNFVENIISNPEDKKFSIVMVDFDNFKKVNDEFGHQFGDEVLIQTTKLISDNLSNNDVVARYGGEEIIIYLEHDKDDNEIFNKIDGVRDLISKNEIIYMGLSKRITASFGISHYPKNGTTLQNVISVADDMMYQSKNSGRNKVSQLL